MDVNVRQHLSIRKSVEIEPDPFEVLGVSKSASADDVKAAYRRLSRKHHPDVGGDSETFARIARAYEAVKDVPGPTLPDEKIEANLRRLRAPVIEERLPDGSSRFTQPVGVHTGIAADRSQRPRKQTPIRGEVVVGHDGTSADVVERARALRETGRLRRDQVAAIENDAAQDAAGS
jgi:curved DNA-binding protein CbpA